MATYGSFPGVKVETESGGLSAVSIGSEEILVLFGEANYAFDASTDSLVVEGDDATLDVSANEAEQITAPRLAGLKFGSGSKLAEGMADALLNGANISYLYGVAVERNFVQNEPQSAQEGELENVSLVENTGYAVDPSRSAEDNPDDMGPLGEMGITVYDGDEEQTVELRYDGAPASPSSDAEADMYVNPLTGQYQSDSSPVNDYEFSYTYNDYKSAFQSRSAGNTVSEGETGIWLALTDSDAVGTDLGEAVADKRTDFALVNAMQPAEPNNNVVYEPANTTTDNGGAEAVYDTSNYADANNSVGEAFFYKFAPGRTANDSRTIGGGVAGLFAGNSITNPIYNDVVSGYSNLQQQFSKTNADEMRKEDIIPVRSSGSVRVKGNRATNYSSGDSVGADFWTRRITDRVILIAKQVGDAILGRINDEDTRGLAERQIERQLRSLASRRLIKGNTGDEVNWQVTAYEDPANSDAVNIDVTFTPYGIVKRVNETITVNTN